MSRTSRIPHPPGTRYVPIYGWACERFGLAGAAVIGLLEFLDRAEELPNRPTASRARLVADLQGIVGRNAVDAALATLEQAGAIARHIATEPGPKNLVRTVRYGIDSSGISRLLGTPEIGISRNSRFWEQRGLPESGPEPGVPSYMNKEETEDAALRGHAAAPSNLGKRRTRRPSGIVTWVSEDEAAAEAIERQHSSEDVAQVVAALAAQGKQPVPGVVEAQLERLSRTRETDARLARELAAQAPFVPDAEAQAVGERLVEKIRARCAREKTV